MPLRIPPAAELAPVLRPHRAGLKSLLLVLRVPTDDSIFSTPELLAPCEDDGLAISTLLELLTDRVADAFASFDSYSAETELAEVAASVPRTDVQASHSPATRQMPASALSGGIVLTPVEQIERQISARPLASMCASEYQELVQPVSALGASSNRYPARPLRARSLNTLLAEVLWTTVRAL